MATAPEELTHLGLFEGIGGFSEAAQWMGWITVAWCEKNEILQFLLRALYPHAKAHGDIKTESFLCYANKIDILSGGFPCQPYSFAGKQLGTEDERHLWPEMRRAIREVQAPFVVGENVPGIVNWNGGMVFNEVQIDLEAEGYEILPFVLPACAVDAPHQRHRVFFCAFNEKFWIARQKQRAIENADKNGRAHDERKEKSRIRGQRYTRPGDNERVPTNNGEIGPLTNAGGEHIHLPIQQRGQEKTENPDLIGKSKSGDVTDADGISGQSGAEHLRREARANIGRGSEGTGLVTDTCSQGLQGRGISGVHGAQEHSASERSCQTSNAADAPGEQHHGDTEDQRGIGKQEQGQPGRIYCEEFATDTECSGIGQIYLDLQRRQSDGRKPHTFNELLDWSEFPTQSPICVGDDGFLTESLRSFISLHDPGILTEKEINTLVSKAINDVRKEAIKGGGNAVVPQVVFRIYQAIKKFIELL